MYSHLVRSSLGAFAALLCLCTSTGNAYADIKSTQTCSAAIIKAGAAFVQKETSILQKCRDAVLKGKVCDPVKLQKDLDAARTKLRDGIVKKCYGKDKSCDTVDADGSQPTLAEIGWEIPACPNFEGGTCTNPITDCDDIPTCIQCIGEASVNQAIDLSYPPSGRPASTGNKILNKCQSTLGKAAATFFTATSKAHAKCWGTKVKKTANCPADAQEAIDKARAKFDKAFAKPCLGLDNSTIGLPSGCPAVKPEQLPACGGTVNSLIDVGNCVSCVNEFKVECPDRVSARSVGAPYPPDCLVVPPTPVPTTTPTATLTPSVTPTPTLTTGPTATETPSGFCGDNIVQVGEFCDGTGPGGACGAGFTCTNCNCACPSKVHFAADAFAPESILDTGWTGISHRAPIITNGDVTVALGCTATERPCGTCTVTGPIPNTKAGAGELDSRRCSNDSSIKCTTDTPCMSGGGTCEFYFGAPLPLAAGGVTTCVVNQFNGAVTGTANVETGEAVNIANLTARVYNGLAIDNPCPRCTDAGGINDGVAGGTCDGGPRLGLACDANGEVANRPDFGRTSLDCPTSPLGLIATLPIDLSNATDPVTRTVTALSPTCGDGSGEKCLCETCNNAVATPCQSNADCVAVGATICGGRRCLGGSNNGGPCNTASACPGGGLCSKAGEPSKPSACLDDTSTVNILDCNDTAPVDGEGECPRGPVTKTCSVASGHGQRACSVEGDCTEPTGGSCPGCCVAGNRPCFLTGTATGFPAGAGAKVGTQTLIAEGMEDPPISDLSSPTLAAVFCVGPTSAGAINAVAGLPGPGRVTIKGQAEGRP